MIGHGVGNTKYFSHHQKSSKLVMNSAIKCAILEQSFITLFRSPHLFFQIFKLLLKLQIDLFSGHRPRWCHISCGDQSKSHLRQWYRAAAGYLNIVQGV